MATDDKPRFLRHSTSGVTKEKGRAIALEGRRRTIAVIPELSGPISGRGWIVFYTMTILLITQIYNLHKSPSPPPLC